MRPADARAAVFVYTRHVILGNIREFQLAEEVCLIQKHNARNDEKYFFQPILWSLLLTASCSLRAQSPCIHKVYDFMPAPGQFTNDLPEYAPGDTRDDMIRKVEK
jgi:hypothetical protein